MSPAAIALLKIAAQEPKEDIRIYANYRRKVDGLGLSPLEHETFCQELAEVLRV